MLVVLFISQRSGYIVFAIFPVHLVKWP